MSVKFKPSTSEKDLGADKLKAQIQEMKGFPYIKIGVLAENNPSVEGGFNLAGVAAVNEFGTDKAGPNRNTKIPSRPFIRSTMEEKKDDFIQATKTALLDIALGKDIVRSLGRVGLRIAEAIKAKISSNMPPENAPSTRYRKGSSSTLIDTGRLRASIRHKVVMKEGD